ncbi:MAG: leucine dehydrogenase [Planctomycetota bacterium]|jgi:leucine dehydrogenase
MAVHVLDAMAREGFEEVVAIHDHRSGLRAFLAIHDTLGGPALGGIRRLTYRDEKEALLDCLRLALHMSFKCILAGIPGGGAKTVIMDRADLDVEAAYRHLGDTIERMQGRYLAGPDIGTGSTELAWVGERTRFASRSGPESAEGPGDLEAATAAGVFVSMEAALLALDGEVDWKRRRVVLQGLGSVGRTLAHRLVNEGAHVMASEIDPDVATQVSRDFGVELIEIGQAAITPCDVFAPCALGGILHDVSIPKLTSRVVCGAANNQLARARHAERMHARGVLYVPDFVVNSGAVMLGAARHSAGDASQTSMGLGEIEARIGGLATEILADAKALDEAPARTAERRARKALAARRDVRPAHLSPLRPVGVGLSDSRPEAPGSSRPSHSSDAPGEAPDNSQHTIEIP